MADPKRTARQNEESRNRSADDAPARGVPAGSGSPVEALLDRADLEQAGASYESAVRTYREAFDAARESRDKGRALLGVGSCLERLGRHGEARTVLEDAAAHAGAADDNGGLGRIRIKLGKVLLHQGNLAAAVECGESALELIDPAEDLSSRGFALNLLSFAHNRKGDPDTSAAYLREALGTFKEAGDIRSLALVYNNLGLLAKDRCDWSKSLEYLQVASSLQAIEGEYPQRRNGLHNLGVVRFKMGRLDRAHEAFTEAESIARGVNDPLGTVAALLGRAGVELARRRWDRALEDLEQVLELCSDNAFPRETALTYRSLAQLHQARGEMNRAQRCYEVAWRKTVEISEEGDLARELLRLRADLAAAAGRLDEAATLAARAVDLSNRHKDPMESALAGASLGRVRVLAGDGEGYTLLREAQDELRRLGSPLPLVQALFDEAELRRDRRDGFARADHVLREARDILQGLGLFELELDALVRLADTAGANGDLDRATECLDQARDLARTLGDTPLRARLEEVQKDVESLLVTSSVNNLGAYRTAGRLEEIMESQRPGAAKLGDVLEVLASALEADGAALVSDAPGFPTATYRIGTSSAQLLGRVLGELRAERPELVLDTTTSGRKPWNRVAEARQASSLMVIPVHSQGPRAYLYFDRLAQGHMSAFGPSHLNLCLALVPQLGAILDRLSRESGDADSDGALHRQIYLADVVTQNAEMVRILKLVEKVSSTDLTVLLQGETGTGKTLIAKAVHLTSDRADGPFVTVDCAALPENLLESELFGYVKGAFTGANVDKKGLFEEANGGTIFLDEIGKSGLGVQRRLLHLLDRGEVRPVGSTAYRKLDVRVICATSKENLLSESNDGAFIKDLFYRLNDIIIKVPSLRDRPEDIPLLADYFMETINRQMDTRATGFSRAAMQRMVRYDWPGNVRELEKAVRRAAILADDSSVGVDLLPSELVDATPGAAPGVVSRENGLRGTIEEMEARMVLDALDRNGWNKTRTAEELGLSRKGLKNKIARYGLVERS